MILRTSRAAHIRVNRAERTDTVIDQTTARTIASWWHSPTSALAPFSHGRDRYDREACVQEVRDLLRYNAPYTDTPDQDITDLFQLFCYLTEEN